ncbi:ATP-binding cassette domain-containing protein [Streptomonospora litoralis]|uniref:Multidrug export ATP-binding/permease protein n=1 Tax=Streptomonospora litoralis TaxID=2498135 RepID=A0A4P6Q413_9ACTN|nr:ABC transporter ATP-binding protein [Streptomonospora litoralis]QBI55438.1 Putative multidrug export ATP-binding/permease protein [Streptomonospora litoralis]
MRPQTAPDAAAEIGSATPCPPRSGRDGPRDSRAAAQQRHGPSRGMLRGLMPHARPFLWRHRRPLLLLGACSLMESGQTFLLGICLARALDEGFLAEKPAAGLAWLAVAAASILLVGPVLRGVFAQLSGLVEPLRDGLVRRAVGGALRRAVADPARAARVERAAVSRLTQQTEIARDSFAGLVLTVRSFLFTAVGALAGMFTLAPELLVVVVPPMLLGLVLFLLTLAPMAAAQRRFLDADEAFADRAGVLRGRLRDLAACGIAGTAVDASRGLIDEAAASTRSLARWTAARTLALGVAGQLPIVLLLVATPWLSDRGVTTGALMGALAYLVQSLLPALQALMTAVGSAGSRLVVVLDRFVSAEEGGADEEEPGRAESGDSGPPVRPAQGLAPAVWCRGVRMSYGAGTPPLVEGFGLTVEAGERIAVVGPSGIGKSTLAHVLSGLHAPDEGAVRLAGRPVAGRSPRELARMRVLLPQQGYVFAGSVRENLAQLEPGAEDDRIARAAAALHLEPLVDRLGGLDGDVDPGTLSAGERQALCLVRAYVSPAPLLILDESTCHLDPAAEAQAEEALAARPNTTLIVVAHRLSSALRADRILVLDGTGTAFGTHDSLLRDSPLYRDLAGLWNASG